MNHIRRSKGALQDKIPPFPPTVVGVFSCHGVEPGTIRYYTHKLHTCIITPLSQMCNTVLLYTLLTQIHSTMELCTSLTHIYNNTLYPLVIDIYIILYNNTTGEDAFGEECVNDKINQDRGCVVCPYRGTKNDSLFMVLDGHGDQGTPPPHRHTDHHSSFPPPPPRSSSLSPQHFHSHSHTFTTTHS